MLDFFCLEVSRPPPPPPPRPAATGAARWPTSRAAARKVAAGQAPPPPPRPFRRRRISRGGRPDPSSPWPDPHPPWPDLVSPGVSPAVGGIRCSARRIRRLTCGAPGPRRASEPAPVLHQIHRLVIGSVASMAGFGSP
ncbi:hypothetical protein PVAP13_2NG336009 [Panicum virgatum]|uniref:Uncharacterized protein n=1 Tax=Panicum virgatum TaxID=38727 RepID=A0A8T0VE65_PANVG|nr:hypothetical protein PVAP13_2NG336009 [Panicum virgatum]